MFSAHRKERAISEYFSYQINFKLLHFLTRSKSLVVQLNELCSFVAKMAFESLAREENRTIERSGISDFHEETERFGPFHLEFGKIGERNVFGLQVS